MRSWRRRLLALGLAIVLELGVLAALVFSGAIWPGRVFASGHDVRGVDVSSYQGEIDWPALEAQGLDFTYIKSTEGSSFVDTRFEANWSGALDTGLLVGAYHFMSFETPGERQAQHVIDTVPDDGTLPVAVDVEFYGEYFADPPAREEVDAILSPLLDRLESHYGVPAVIYATPEAYDLYIADAYSENPVWIRSVVLPPRLADGRDWTIWQYSHRDRLDGYDGDEDFIDMNVFTGELRQLAGLARRD